jgi:hypothetical protein
MQLMRSQKSCECCDSIDPMTMLTFEPLPVRRKLLVLFPVYLDMFSRYASYHHAYSRAVTFGISATSSTSSPLSHLFQNTSRRHSPCFFVFGKNGRSTKLHCPIEELVPLSTCDNFQHLTLTFQTLINVARLNIYFAHDTAHKQGCIAFGPRRAPS